MQPPFSRVARPTARPLPPVQPADPAPPRQPTGPPGSRPRIGHVGIGGPGVRGSLPGPGGLPRGGFGLPNLRRNICPHFYMTGSRGAIPIQAPHLLKALVRQEANVSRCQLRGGVHLEQGYVNDVCLSARFNQCVFYEDDLGS